MFGLPSLDFLLESRELAKDPAISSYMAAVASVTDDSRLGTGFNIASDGLIVTNSHVIEAAATIDLRFSERNYQALTWQTFPASDLAFIDIEAEGLPYLTLAPEADPSPGDDLIVIGNPLGFFLVAERATYVGQTKLSEFSSPVLVIKGDIFKGHSGSPVINDDGQVIGIIFATTQSDVDDETLALAIPAEEIERQLKNTSDLSAP